MSEVVIKMTPFVFEDGQTYYFKILDRSSDNDYFDLHVYKKVVIKRSFLWWKWENYRYDLLNKKPEFIGIHLEKSEITRDIKKIIHAKCAKHQISGWDGFVGDVPDDIKKAMIRDSKLDDLLK